MTVADDHLARVGPELDAWDRSYASLASAFDDGVPSCALEALALLEALAPIIPPAIKLGAGQVPGADATADASWAAMIALARRDLVAQQSAGTDRGLADDSLRLLDRLESLVGEWPDDWEELARQHVDELVDARRRGRQRGRALREERPAVEPEPPFDVAWLLRHPTDHYLRFAARSVGDSECRALIERQIARVAPNYAELCGLDWTAQEAAASLICEMEVLDASPGGWQKPASGVVTKPIKGSTSLSEQIAIRLVEDAVAPFNGTLASFLVGDRWLICARELGDATLLPLAGTRRCGPPSA